MQAQEEEIQLALNYQQGKDIHITQLINDVDDVAIVIDEERRKEHLATPKPKPSPTAQPKAKQNDRRTEAPVSRPSDGGKVTVLASSGTASKFPAGWCTAYAASKFPVTWRGNAAQWSQNARAQGYNVNKTPEAGALLVTNENSRNCPKCGHVAVIDMVDDQFIYVSEMNYEGFGVVSKRKISRSSSVVAAVIHAR